MTSLFDNVDSLKNFRTASETTMQHSIFDRKRQIYLLKNVNRCTDTFSNSVDVRRRVSQSLGELLYISRQRNQGTSSSNQTGQCGERYLFTTIVYTRHFFQTAHIFVQTKPMKLPLEMVSIV